MTERPLPSSAKAMDDLAAAGITFGLKRQFALRRAAAEMLDALVMFMGANDEHDFSRRAARGFTLAQVVDAVDGLPRVEGKPHHPLAAVPWFVRVLSSRLESTERPVGFEALSVVGQVVSDGFGPDSTVMMEVHRLIWVGPVEVDQALLNGDLVTGKESVAAYWALVTEIETLINVAVGRVRALERASAGVPSPTQRISFPLRRDVDRDTAYDIAAGVLLRHKPELTAVPSLFMHPPGDGSSDYPAIVTLRWELQYDLNEAEGRDGDWGHDANERLADQIRDRLEDRAGARDPRG